MAGRVSALLAVEIQPAFILYLPILGPSEKVILIKSCSARNIHKWQVSEKREVAALHFS